MQYYKILDIKLPFNNPLDNGLVVNSKAYIIGKHQCASFNDELVRFFVFDNSGSQTSCRACFAAGVDGTRTEFLYLSASNTNQIQIVTCQNNRSLINTDFQ